MKIKLNKQRVAALLASGIVLMTASGCGAKKETKKDYSSIETMVTTTEQNIDDLGLNINDDTVDNASIILLLDVLAKQDENGKISPELISQFKNKIDSDNMMDKFNSFLDMLEDYIIKNEKVQRISTVLPDELKDDKEILSRIETILENAINAYKTNNKTLVEAEFNKIYKLYVDEEEIEENGLKFDIRDLSYSSREVANTYAEIVDYFSKGFVSQDKLNQVDKRTNDQNSKAYIKTNLEILKNQMNEKSETDETKLFYDGYAKLDKLVDGKIKLNATQEKELVNYINLGYLNSDKVSTKDKKTLLGDYEENKISETILAVDAISEYNFNNQTARIQLSKLLVNNYLKTDCGKTDKLALDFVEYNSIKLLNSVNENTKFDDLLINPYYKNLYKYLTKQNLIYTHNVNGKQVNTDIKFQEISDGVNYINYEIILRTLNKLSNIKELSGAIDKTKLDLSESILYIQNAITGECQKTNTKQFVK